MSRPIKTGKRADSRTKKLLEAKAMAEKDIAKYKQRQEEIFNEEKAKILAKAEQDSKHIGTMKGQSEQIEKDYTANKEKVIEDLLSRILTCELEVPKVVKGDFE